jgi:branched-chain amino acid transport system permease protein
LADRPVPAGIYLNVAVRGLLTGLVYGLMALGFPDLRRGARRQFRPRQMMTIAMYLAIALFSAYKLDPLVMLVPISGVICARLRDAARAHQSFINRPEHSQFMLLVAIALIMVNGSHRLRQTRRAQTRHASTVFMGRLIVDATGYAGAAALVVAAALFASSASRWPARPSGPAPTTCRRPGGRARRQRPMR